jgi:hypothetical protein
VPPGLAIGRWQLARATFWRCFIRYSSHPGYSCFPKDEAFSLLLGNFKPIKSMSVPFLKEAVETGDAETIIRFVRLHLGDGNEEVGRREIDKSWVEAVKILLKYDPTNGDFIEKVLQQDQSTLALLYFHLHFYLIRKSGEWIHDGSR